MDRRHGGTTYGADSNFTDILNRTRQNISRISSRYSAEALDQSSYSQSRSHTRFGEPFDFEKYSSSSVKEKSLVGYERKTDSEATENRPPSAPARNEKTASNLDEILDRLSRLEQDSSDRFRFEERMLKLETSVDGIRAMVDSLVSENREGKREISKLSNQISSQGTTLEILQHDVDSRRSTIAKMDAWVRQGEMWRTDIETQLGDIAAQNKVVHRVIAENKEHATERVTKADLEILRDRLNISAQQSVQASLAAWHDKVELSVRHLERQVAALRLGGTVTLAADGSASGSAISGLAMSDDEVKKALMTQQPSELLLKGVVSSEVRAMETDLERKMQLHMTASIRSEVHDSHREIKDEVKQFVKQLVTNGVQNMMFDGSVHISSARAGPAGDEGGDGGGDTDTSLALGKFNFARKEKEREMMQLVDRVDDLSSVLLSMQESADAKDKSAAIEYRALERRLEECVSMSSAYVNTVQTRAADLERRCNESENSQKIRHSQLRDELLDRITEISQFSTAVRVELDKRMLLSEKMVESVMERVDMSKSVFEGLFASSPDVKRFQVSAVKLEGLLTEFTSLRSDVRDVEGALHRLQSGIAKKDEMSELRERLAHVESAARKVDDVVERLQKLQDDVACTRSDCRAADSSICSLKEHHQSLVERLSTAESALSATEKEMRQSCDNVEKTVLARLASSGESFREESKASHSAMQQLHTTVSGISSSLSSLSGTVQVLQDRNDVTRSNMKENKTTFAKLECSVLQNQKDINSLQYQFSKIQSESHHESSGLKELRKQMSRAHDRLDKMQQFSSAASTALPSSARSGYPGAHTYSAGVDDTDDESVTIGGKTVIEPSKASPLRSRTPPPPTVPQDDSDEDDEDEISMPSAANLAVSSSGPATSVSAIRAEPDIIAGLSDEDDDVNDITSSPSSPNKSHKKKYSGASLTVRGVMQKSSGDDKTTTRAIGSGSSVIDTTKDKAPSSPLRSSVRSVRDMMEGSDGDSSDDVESIEQIESIDKDEVSSPPNVGQPSDTVGVSDRVSTESPAGSIPSLVDQDDPLSSAGTSPSKTPTAKVRDFTTSLDNSFDDSMDMSPLAPSRPDQRHGSPPKDSQRSPLIRRRSGDLDSPITAESQDTGADDDMEETPRYRPDAAASAMAAEIADGDGYDDDGVDKVKSFSLISASDDGGNTTLSRTLDSFAISDDDSTESVDKAVSQAKPHYSPGKLPKSSSSKFSHELEEVVRGYWSTKGSDDGSAASDSKLPTSNEVCDEEASVRSNSGADNDEDMSNDWDDSDTSPVKPTDRKKNDPITPAEKANRPGPNTSPDDDSDIDVDDDLLMSGKKAAPSAAIENVEAAAPAADPYEGLTMMERLQLRRQQIREQKSANQPPSPPANKDDSDESDDSSVVLPSDSDSDTTPTTTPTTSPDKKSKGRDSVTTRSSLLSSASVSGVKDNFDSNLSDDNNHSSPPKQPTSAEAGIRVAKRFGTRKFGDSDDSDSEGEELQSSVAANAPSGKEGEDMVMSFDDDFDDSFLDAMG